MWSSVRWALPFLILLAARELVEGACQSSTITTGLSGTISVTNFPTQNYSKTDNCLWTFNFTDGTGRLAFTFDSRFATAANKDYLVVYDTLSPTDDNLLAKWSGVLSPDPLLTSVPFATINFTAIVGNYVGWSFNWSRVSSSDVATASGGSVNMAGSTDTMGCPGGASGGPNTKLDIGNTLTLEAWIKPSDLSAQNFWYRIVHYRGSSQKYVMALNGGLTGTGMNQRNLVFTKCDAQSGGTGSGCGNVYNTPTDSIKVGVWQHVAVVYNSANLYATPVSNTQTTARWIVYINGVQQAYQQVTSNTFGDPTFPPTQLGIASNPGSSVGAYKGSIDDLRIWNIVVPKASIQARMNGGLVGNEAGLVAWFKFDEASGALYLNDSSTAVAPPLSGCILGYGTGQTAPHRTVSTFPITGVCGNGFVEDGEACDDGNTVNGDCCSSDCDTPAAPFTVCRAAAGVCDAPEYCIITGSTAGRCPTDSFNSTLVCRPSAGDAQCDPPEVCNGTAAACPVDIKYAVGKTCNDSSPCTYSDQCQSSYACAGTALSPACSANGYCSENSYATSSCVCNWGYVGDGVTCAVATCSAIASTTTTTSSCNSGTTAIGGTCTLSCASAYAGTATTRTCTQSGPGVAAVWSGSTPTCTATSCAALTSGSLYTSSCASVASVGASCSRVCNTGYSGTSTTHTCIQTTVGATATYDNTNAPTCTVTQCAAVASTSLYTSTCTSAVNVGGTCTLACVAGYAGTTQSRNCGQSPAGSTAAWDNTNLPTCTATVCAAIASGSNYASACASSTTAYGAGCVLSCAAGYAGTSVTRNCQQSSTGAVATFDSTAPPTCAVTSCGSLTSGTLYTSSCTSGAPVGGTCQRVCNSGYTATNTTHVCIQASVGAAATYDNTGAPSCVATQCAGVAGTSSYSSSCPSSTNVGGNCQLSCAAGYAGTTLTRTCNQSPAGSAAAWSDSSLPACSVSSCAAIPSGTGYVSACSSGTTAYLSNCNIVCATGYAGTSVSPQCQQSSTGVPVTFTSTTPPTCTFTQCAPLSSAATYDSGCASTNTPVGSSCTRSCARGYAGTATTSTCSQASTGATAAFSPTTAPTCALTTCAAIASGSTYTSSCASATTAVDSTCTLTCSTGYTGAAAVRTCQQLSVGGTASFDSTAAPSCVTATCPAIPSGSTYASACSSSTTNYGSTCVLACAPGYAGSSVTRTCTQSSAGAAGSFDSTTPPTCTATSCAAISSGTGYTSACASSTTTYGATCGISCAAGYVGTAVTRTCQQSSTGVAATFDSTAPPSCAVTSCSALSSGSLYTSSCTSGAAVGTACQRVCNSGYAGANTTHNCVQSAPGMAAGYDSSATPSCTVTQCGTVAATSSYTSTCASAATNVGATCTLACAAGYAGSSVSRTCGQAPLGSAAAWSSTTVPTCTVSSCAAISSGTGYTSACASGTTAYLATCSIACASGYAGTAVTPQCTQSSTGAPVTFTSTTPPTCSVTTCAALASTASYTSSCASSTTSVGATCTRTCAHGYAGSATTDTCSQATVGAAAAFTPNTTPTCTATTCAAIATGGTYTSACASSTTAVDATCVLSCATNYTGASVTRTCQQLTVGTVASFDSTLPPSCMGAGCPVIAGGASYTSACNTSTTAVGSTCKMSCAPGYAGSAVTHTCTQGGAGSNATFDDVSPPSCVVTTCAAISGATGYTSTCASSTTSVGGTCSLACASGYTGSAVGPYTCQQSAVGAAATFSSTTPPACAPVTCPALAAGAQYTSSCSSGVSTLSATCTFTCSTGYAGSSVLHTCTQSVAGAAGAWDSVTAPSCAVTSCPAITSGTSYDSGCTGTTAVGATCTLSCAHGYSGTPFVRNCQQSPAGAAAAFDSTAPPTCPVTSCPSLASDSTQLSSCASGSTAVDATCTRQCRGGYAGAAVVSTCQQNTVGASAAYDTTTAPTCTVTTCASVPSTGSYISTCSSSTSNVNGVCTLACAHGLAGNAATRSCIQLSTGAAASWNLTTTPTCVATTCAPISGGGNYTSSCASTNTGVDNTCTLACGLGYTGTAVVRTCQQLLSGVPASFDSTSAPSCVVTTCPAIAGGAIYGSSCSATTTALGATCTLACAPGYAGTTVTYTCNQASAGAAGAFSSTSPPTCTATSCAAIPSATGYVSGCASGTTAVGGSCSLSCAVGYTGSDVGPYTCGQTSTGAAATFSATTPPSCTPAVCAPLSGGSLYDSNCDSADTPLGGKCKFTCSVGYMGANNTYSCTQSGAGSPGSWGATAAPTCTATSCAAIASGASYVSGCLSTTAVGSTCTISCAHAYSGSAVTHTCGQVVPGVAATFESTSPPTCALTSCTALTPTAAYSSTCSSGSVAVDGVCTRQCKTGYAGAGVASTCQQTAVGAVASYDTSTPPNCVATTCPAVPSTVDYTSTCASAAVAVGGGCTMTCVAGKAGAQLSRACLQTSVGATASWNVSTLPTCTVTTCAPLPTGSTYTSTCDSTSTSVNSQCTMTCASGYTGSAVTRTCQQLSLGAAAAFDSTNPPACSGAVCASIPDGSTYDSDCSTSTTAINATCTIVCLPGYAGTAVVHTCTQVGVGASGVFDSTAPPTCSATSCAAIPSGLGYVSTCDSTITAVGGSCSLACTSGYTGSSVGPYLCGQTSTGAAATFSSTVPPTCVATTCPALAAGSLYTSSCASGATALAGTCSFTCSTGYAGAKKTHTCQQASAGAAGTWDTTTAPSCAVTRCAAIADGAAYDSGCPGATNVGSSCILSCAHGYSGSAVSHLCQQSPAGSIAAFDSTAAPTCTPTSCPSLSSGVTYDSTCDASTVDVDDTCVRACEDGYAGTAVTYTCQQNAVGGTAAYDVSAPPTCAVTNCPAIPSTADYDSECDGGDVGVGTTCTMRCVHGEAGDAVTRTCLQTSTGAPATWDTLDTPICGLAACSALSSGSTFVSTCDSSTTAVDATCTMSCAAGYTGASTTSTCRQLSVGGPVAYDNTTTPTCAGAVCGSLPGGVTYTSQCATATTAFGATCTLSCAAGYSGSAVSHTCVQTGTGSTGAFDSTAAPSCIPTACDPIPSSSDGSYISSCDGVITAVDGTCSLQCAAGLTGATTGPLTCYQAFIGAAATFEAGPAPTCVAAVCPSLPSGSQFTSSCSGGFTALGDTCSFTCSLGYAGPTLTHTCTQANGGDAGSWDSVASPACSVTSCPAITSGTDFDSGCVGTTAVGSTCTLSCAHGYSGAPVTHLCDQPVEAAPAVFDSTAPPQCDPTSCPALTDGATFSSTCALSTVNVDATCTRACRGGYAGAFITSTCQQSLVGTGASYDITSMPTCISVTCPALASTADYTSTCESAASDIGANCTLACRAGEAGSTVVRICKQTSTAVPAAWDPSSTPSCTVTTCGAIASGPGYISACDSASTAVGATCALSCAHGYAGFAVVHTCKQYTVGGTAVFDSVSAPLCTATTCPTLPAAATYLSDCVTDRTQVDSNCTRTCKHGYAGVTAMALCQQSSIGANATYINTAAPTCAITKCAAVPNTASYTTTCSSTAVSVDSGCTLSCATGYAGSSVSRSCVQTSDGAGATWDVTTTPACTATTCPAIAADTTYSSSCTSTTTNVGGNCTLACLSGFGGGAVVRRCQQPSVGATTAWTGGAFSCSALTCVPIPGDVTMGSDCDSGSHNIGEICHLVCQNGYLGGNATRTCTLDSGTNTAVWSGANPACVLASCPIIAETASTLSSCKAGTSSIGASCSVSCRPGYVGLARSAQCMQAAAGMPGAWSTALTASCVPGQCAAVAAGERYTSTCESGLTTMGGTCQLACKPGQVGATVTLSCVADDTWDSSFIPDCQDCQSCAPGEFELTPCTATAQPTCQVCTVCQHGHYIQIPCNATVDATCTLCSECGEAYYVSGNCTDTQDTQCERISCGAPVALINGTIDGVNFTVGGSVAFTCQPGFVLTGATEAMCTLQGVWDKQTPVCVDSTSFNPNGLQSGNTPPPASESHNYSLFMILAIAVFAVYAACCFVVIYAILHDRREHQMREKAHEQNKLGGHLTAGDPHLLPIGMPITGKEPPIKSGPDTDGMNIVNLDDSTGAAPTMGRQESSKMGKASLPRNGSSEGAGGLNGKNNDKKSGGKKNSSKASPAAAPLLGGATSAAAASPSPASPAPSPLPSAAAPKQKGHRRPSLSRDSVLPSSATAPAGASGTGPLRGIDEITPHHASLAPTSSPLRISNPSPTSSPSPSPTPTPGNSRPSHSPIPPPLTPGEITPSGGVMVARTELSPTGTHAGDSPATTSAGASPRVTRPSTGVSAQPKGARNRRLSLAADQGATSLPTSRSLS